MLEKNKSMGITKGTLNSQFFIKRGININKGYYLRQKSYGQLSTRTWIRIN